MADTAREKDAFVNVSTGLFKTNTSGEVSQQNLRDFVESMHASFGSCYVSSAAETTISSPNTWTKAAGTTTSVNLHRFTMPANNRLLYTGTPDIHIHGVASISSSIASGTNKVIGYGAYHYDDSAASGSVLAHSELRRNHGTNDIGALAIHFDAVMETNDYFEIHIKNVTDTINATLDFAYLFILGMFM